MWFWCQRFDALFYFCGVVTPPRHGLDSQSCCGFLGRTHHGLKHGNFRHRDHQNAADIGCSLLEHLQPLATHRRIVTSETGDIAVGMSKTGNKATADRIADTDEHDRYASGDWLHYL